MAEELHDKASPKLWAKLTPGGVRVDLIGMLTALRSLMTQGHHDQVVQHLQTFEALFVATARGNFALIERSYTEAAVANLLDDLDNEAAVAALLEEDK